MLYKILNSDRKICLQEEGNPYQAVNPPIVQSSLFTFKSLEDYRQYRLKNREQYCYTRGNNPTTHVVEEKLAALERGERCRVFSSGMGAASAALLGHLKSGDHVLFVNTIYGPVLEYAKFIRRFGIEYSYIRDTDIAAIQEALKPNTRIIYLESPGSADFKVVDLRAVAKLAHDKGITSIIDNTCLTPLFQKPLELGIDIVIHSCSKYIGGHADLIAGAVITSRKLMQPINDYCYKLHGAVLSPHDAALLLRGIRTLPTRIEAGLETTAKVVEFLQNHPRVIKVNHPLAYSQADKLVFMAQATGYTSLLSFELKADSFAEMGQFIDKLRTFHIGVSWGGYENLVVAPNLGNDFAEVIARGEKPNLIRLALGLFNHATIIADLEQALING